MVMIIYNKIDINIDALSMFINYKYKNKKKRIWKKNYEKLFINRF